jgi:hypothetical protein
MEFGISVLWDKGLVRDFALSNLLLARLKTSFCRYLVFQHQALILCAL